MPDVEKGVDKHDAEHEASSIATAQPGQHLDTEPTAASEREFTIKARSQWELILRRFLAHKLAVVSLLVFVLLVLVSYLGPHVWHYTYADFTGDYSKGPSLKHPFGTDDVGRDILSRCVSGLALDLRVSVEVTGLSLLIGVTLGSIAGCYVIYYLAEKGGETFLHKRLSSGRVERAL